MATGRLAPSTPPTCFKYLGPVVFGIGFEAMCRKTGLDAYLTTRPVTDLFQSIQAHLPSLPGFPGAKAQDVSSDDAMQSPVTGSLEGRVEEMPLDSKPEAPTHNTSDTPTPGATTTDGGKGLVERGQALWNSFSSQVGNLASENWKTSAVNHWNCAKKHVMGNQDLFLTTGAIAFCTPFKPRLMV